MDEKCDKDFDAKSDAELRGGQLAILDTQQKIDDVKTFLSEIGSWPKMWIDASDSTIEGVWAYGSTELNSTNWMNGQPDNRFGLENGN